MDKVYIGKVVNTHGIKGEIRILSHFPYKNKVFIVHHKIIINDLIFSWYKLIFIIKYTYIFS